MKTFNITVKKEYTSPTIEIVILDNEVSLVLESSPPSGPDEVYLSNPESYTHNPLNT